MNLNRFNQLLESQMGNVKPLISEQTSKTPKDISQDQAKFEDYVQNKMFPTEDDVYMGEEVDWDGESYKICAGGCKQALLSPDSDIVSWNFKTKQITGTKSFGIDPKPIPLNSSYNDSVKWFDSWFEY